MYNYYLGNRNIIRKGVIILEKRNLMIMTVTNFFVAASFTMVVPFLSLYIKTFGDYSDAYVQQWSAYVFAVTFFIAFLVSPLWGRFGDKFGRKKILIITGFGIAISIFLMGFANSVMELFVLRLLMGFVTGFIPTSMALISTQTKKEEAGRVLATVQMGTVSGGLIGPLMGGVLADIFGFSSTFFITGILIFIATFFVIFGIHEVVIEDGKSENKKKHSMKEVIVLIFKNPMLVMVMFVSFLVQTSNFSIQPQLALYVTQIMTGENIAFLAGFAFSVTGLGNLLATRSWGGLGDRIGYEKVMFFCLVLGAIFFLPQGMVTSVWQLIILRFFYGMVIGGIVPSVTAFIRQAAPVSAQGEVLGYNQSFKFLGNMLGPIAGGLISSYWSIATVFYFSGTLLIVAAVFMLIMLRKNHGTARTSEERVH